MGEILKKRIKQDKFASSGQEALINIMVTANYLRSKLDVVCGEFGLTGPQYNVLRILRAVHPHGYPRYEIIARMIEQSPDITRLIDMLIRKRLVERFQSNEDRRHSMAKITQKGLQLLEQVAPRVKKFNDTFSKVLTKEEATELSRLCEKIYGPEL